MSQRRFYHFSYMSHQKEDRSLWPHQVRDGDAFAELSPVLLARGWNYGGIVFNYPADTEGDRSKDFSATIGDSDLLVLTTRPPLSDRPLREKKVVTPSGTWLEERIFDALRSYFSHCSRAEVALQSRLASQLPRDYSNRAILNFYISTEAAYKMAISYKEAGPYAHWNENTTASYLTYTDALWKGGPRLLAVFCMSGTMGLIWAYLVRTRFPELLDGPRVVVAEMKRQGPLPRSPLDLSFADQWEVNLVLNQRGPQP